MMAWLKDGSTYEEVREGFRWSIPEHYNMAHDVCDQYAGSDRLALIEVGEDGSTTRYSFKQVQELANRVANVLVHAGAAHGDRVMILLGQHPYAAITHVACWKAGLVSVPTSVLFGAEALAYRLSDSGAAFAVTDRENLPKLQEAQESAGSLRGIFLVDGEEAGAPSLNRLSEQASGSFTNVATKASDPAFMCYTSGTTGWPKGALHGHQSMLGHAPAARYIFDFMPHEGDVMWSPADWSWLAGLMDVLMPAWYYGIPVVASRRKKFDPEDAFATIARFGVTVSLLTPTILKLMRQVPNGTGRHGARLRCVASGGEAVGAELLEWANSELKTTVNEVYGQTECNLVLASCARMMPVKPGSLGLATPGQTAAIVDDEGRLLGPGETGNIAFKAPNPIHMLRYWNKPDATVEKYAGEWMISGDSGQMDEDGYFWFQGRADDVITSSGYRIGPGEIEDALTSHPRVANSAVVGIPDEERTERIKAFVVLSPGTEASDELKSELESYVGQRLARHERPREIEFVAELPMTVTGKIQRRELRDREIARLEAVQQGEGTN